MTLTTNKSGWKWGLRVNSKVLDSNRHLIDNRLSQEEGSRDIGGLGSSSVDQTNDSWVMDRRRDYYTCSQSVIHSVNIYWELTMYHAWIIRRQNSEQNNSLWIFPFIGNTDIYQLITQIQNCKLVCNIKVKYCCFENSESNLN